MFFKLTNLQNKITEFRISEDLGYALSDVKEHFARVLYENLVSVELLSYQFKAAEILTNYIKCLILTI